MGTSDVKKIARSSRNATVLRVLARIGFGVNGLVNAIIGFIAIGIAVSGSGSADQSGAFAAVAATPGGSIALWVIAIALQALGVWYLLGSFVAYGRDTKRRVAKIAVEIGRGLAYTFLAVAAFGFLTGPGADSSSQAKTFTAMLLAAPGGVVVIVLIGILFAAVGVYMVRKGVTRGFERDISIPDGSAGRSVQVLGTVGYVARGIALFIVGVLFLVASATVDPTKATGLDGALKTLVGLPYGQWILGIVGLGFVAYGVYSILRSRLARLH